MSCSYWAMCQNMLPPDIVEWVLGCTPNGVHPGLALQLKYDPDWHLTFTVHSNGQGRNPLYVHPRSQNRITRVDIIWSSSGTKKRLFIQYHIKMTDERCRCFRYICSMSVPIFDRKDLTRACADSDICIFLMYSRRKWNWAVGNKKLQNSCEKL
jgi:hypothetical protein